MGGGCAERNILEQLLEVRPYGWKKSLEISGLRDVEAGDIGITIAYLIVAACFPYVCWVGGGFNGRKMNE